MVKLQGAPRGNPLCFLLPLLVDYRLSSLDSRLSPYHDELCVMYNRLAQVPPRRRRQPEAFGRSPNTIEQAALRICAFPWHTSFVRYSPRRI